MEAKDHRRRQEVKTDAYGRRMFDETELCDLLYANPGLDLSKFTLADPSKHNQAISINYSDLSKLQALEILTLEPAAWHKQNQTHWHMPEEYRDLDIAKWILDRCEGSAELQRCGAELLEYEDRNLMPLLCYLKYLVDVMRSNGIVWGVGRGSSVASFVLYKLGVHRINSLYYDLDFNEFMR